VGTKCPECDTVNPFDSKYCKECATPLPSSKKIPVTENLETPTEELTRETRFLGKHEITRYLNLSFKVEDSSPSKNHKFFIIQRNL
jgi:hypothetical protein